MNGWLGDMNYEVPNCLILSLSLARVLLLRVLTDNRFSEDLAVSIPEDEIMSI